ncbi:PAS domain S-box protein [Salibacter sp.]|uniref:sensor histidine kinase n=1 Tax=Salibacter sp. TaxID=2010995 RepID=UPI00287030DA|nr:PAS domain S-box protein [Salibacter sp.]MDR9397465.1 PAS domain S-box protein [Salibacter sp.]MDR9486699.1 PAS domain S-box protein [Salibacter sp.]
MLYEKELFDLLTEKQNIGIWKWDLCTDTVYYSKSWGQLLGYEDSSELDTTFKTYESHVLPEDLEKALKPVNEHLKKHTDYFEKTIYRMVKKDGTIIYTEHQGKAKFENNKPVYVVGLMRNVDEEHRNYKLQRETAQFLNNIFDLSPSLIFVKNSNGDFIKVNQAVADLFGKDKEEIENFNNSEVHKVKSELDQFDSFEREVLNKNKSLTKYEDFTTYKGENRIYRTTKSPFNFRGERMIFAVSENVTELRNSKEREENLRKKYQRLIETTSVGLLQLDKNCTINYANRGAYKILNNSELEGGKLKDLITDFDKDKICKFFENNSHHERIKFKAKSKTDNKWLQVYADKFESKTGNSFEIILIDITKEFKLNREKDYQSKLLNSISKYNSDIICIHKPNVKIKFIGASVKNVLGYEPEELIGKNPFEMTTSTQKREVLDSLLVKLINKEITHYEGEIEMFRKNGDKIILETNAKGIYEDGRLIEIVSTSRDISKRRELEKEKVEVLRKSQELINLEKSIIDMGSHQLKTPISTILTNLELLNSSFKNIDKSKYFLRIKKQLNKLLDIIANLLENSKLDSDNFRASHLKKIPLKKLEQSLKSYYHNNEDQFKRLKFDLCIDVKVRMDIDLTTTILTNFIDNSLKYSTGEVKINCKKEEKFIKLSVTDNGIGIPEKDKASLFKPFFRGSNTKNYEGTGLGLLICKKAANMQDAGIMIESNVNKGTSSFVVFKDR